MVNILNIINDNGLWIKDEIDNEIYIINGASKKEILFLKMFLYQNLIKILN